MFREEIPLTLKASGGSMTLVRIHGLREKPTENSTKTTNPWPSSTNIFSGSRMSGRVKIMRKRLDLTHGLWSALNGSLTSPP